MKNVLIEKQLNILRPGISFALYLHYWFIGSALLFVILSIIYWNPILVMIAFFLGFVGFFEFNTGLNIVKAINAYDTGVETSGNVKINIIEYPDSEDVYRVMVSEQNQPVWTYTFIPQNWKPVSGEYTARIWRLKKDGIPAFCATEKGVLIPRSAPIIPMQK